METFTQSSKRFGKDRVQFAQQAQTEEDWSEWKENFHPYVFEAGPCWNFTVEYRVTDFVSEVGFFIDLLGFDCNSFSEDYCMLMSPKREFYFSVKKSDLKHKPTPPDAIGLQFMVDDIVATEKALVERGIPFHQAAQPMDEGSPMYTARFSTPNGIEVTLWGLVESREQ